MYGPRVTLDKETSLVVYSSLGTQKRGVDKLCKSINCEVLDINEYLFELQKEFSWLAQLLWGQQLTLESSKELKNNPDTAIGELHLYK